MNEPFHTRRRAHHLVGLALAAASLASLLLSAKTLGYARDEGFYFVAARSYQRWFDVLFQEPGRAVTKPTIDRYWSYNSEHPAVMKTLFGFSNRIFTKKLGWLSPSTSFRLPGMLTAALCVYLIYLWGATVFGARAGFFAAAAFALLPRPFYHAHLACFDMPMTAFWLLVTYLYWRSLASWRLGLAAGVAFGFALGVKLNAAFMPLVLGFHYACLVAHRCLNRTGAGAPWPKPWAFLFGLVVAPPIFIGHWPWLWHDTLARLKEYVGFHSTHSHYNTAWFGENIIGAPTPLALPTVMTLLTIPTVVIALTLAGSLLRLRHHLPRFVERRLADACPPRGPVSTNGLDLLLLLTLVFPIALISLPDIPKFGGTKHWMPAFPAMAILAGAAASRLSDLAASLFSRFPAKAVGAFTVAFLLLAPLQQTITSHPFGLCSYVPLVGGAPGAASLGMTRQFWGYTTAGVLPWLNEHVPRGGTVFFHDTVAPSVEMFREEGALRRDIRSTDVRRSSFALLHHELHMIRNEAWIWNDYGTIVPAHVLTYQGVPIVSVYERPSGDGRPRPEMRGDE
ncbi:MAG: glycosyltransferase family 39 protein [Deltaproteobacteria bacterium]|nr:glycosyltransferase family 39 protein [Deltaproteobacteria bacterium]